MNAANLSPQELLAKSVAKSFWDLMFTVAWAVTTIYLLLPLWWWLAAASFAALALVSLLEVLRMGGLVFSVAAVANRLGSGRAHHVGSVGVQLVELVLGLVLCVWVYRAVFAG